MKTSIMSILYQLEKSLWSYNAPIPYAEDKTVRIKVDILDKDGIRHSVNDLVGVVSHAERCNFSLRSSDSIHTVPIIKDGEVKVQFMVISVHSDHEDRYLVVDEDEHYQELRENSPEVLIPICDDRPVYDLIPFDEYNFYKLYHEEVMTSLEIKALNQIKRERNPKPKAEKSESTSSSVKEVLPTKEVACLYYEIKKDFDDSSVLEGILDRYRSSSDEDIEKSLKYFRARQTHLRFLIRYYTYCYEFTGSVKWSIEKPMPKSKKKVLRESTIYDGSLIRRISWASKVSV